MKPQRLLQGAGVAALVLFPFYRSLLDMPSDLRMHSPVSFTSLAFSLIANLVLVTCIVSLTANWLLRIPSGAWVKLFLPALVFASLAEILRIASGGWESTRLWIVMLSALLCLSILLRCLWRRGEKLLLQLSAAAMMGAGFFSIVVIFQLLHVALWHPSRRFISDPAPVTAVRAGRPRIVWIVFDELSYRETFGGRFPGLQLPNFDAFRQVSTVFTQTQPIVNETRKAIPSMLLGQKITRVEYTTKNRLEIGGSNGPLYRFEAARTPFALARQRGLTTGVVGWYNPYCGLLSPYVNECYWNHEWQGPPAPTQISFAKNLWFPWSSYGAIFRDPSKLRSRSYRSNLVENLMVPGTATYVGNRVYVFRDLMRHANRMLADSGPDFLFLHLPVPHPPGFYNRKTRQFDNSGRRSYIDNLALADETLGEIMTVLKQSSRWKDTSIVVCGDHSWRVYIWTRSVHWTDEGEQASHGIFDPRPVLMVHLAGQTTGETVDAPFSLLHVHNILDDLIQGKQPAYASGDQNAQSLPGQ